MSVNRTPPYPFLQASLRDRLIAKTEVSPALRRIDKSLLAIAASLVVTTFALDASDVCNGRLFFSYSRGRLFFFLRTRTHVCAMRMHPRLYTYATRLLTPRQTPLFSRLYSPLEAGARPTHDASPLSF
jgi:hypothetical protein